MDLTPFYTTASGEDDTRSGGGRAPGLGPQHGLEHLARRAGREAVPHLDDAGALVGGQVVPRPGGDLVGRGGCPRLEDDHGLDLLAVAGVGDADHRGLGHGGVAVQDLLDLAGVDVVSITYDQVFFSVDDAVGAVVVVGAEV